MENYVGRIVKFSLFINTIYTTFYIIFSPFQLLLIKTLWRNFCIFFNQAITQQLPSWKKFKHQNSIQLLSYTFQVRFSQERNFKIRVEIYIVYRETCHVHKIVLFIYSRVFETINSVFIRKEGNLAFILIIEEFKKQEQG